MVRCYTVLSLFFFLVVLRDPYVRHFETKYNVKEFCFTMRFLIIYFIKVKYDQMIMIRKRPDLFPRYFLLSWYSRRIQSPLYIAIIAVFFSQADLLISHSLAYVTSSEPQTGAWWRPQMMLQSKKRNRQWEQQKGTSFFQWTTKRHFLLPVNNK